jgi:hypothetical protein
MSFESDELEGAIYDIFHPEPIVGNEGIEHHEIPPSIRLTTEYGFDTTYWKYFEYGTMSPLTRRTRVDDKEIATIIHAQQVPSELFMGTLRLFGDSLITYNTSAEYRERKGPYRYYPAILMSAWAAFEAYLRIYSELLVKTVPTLPALVRLNLLEKEEQLDRQGNVVRLTRYRSLMDRYWWFLKYGFGYEFDRGSRIWQRGESALDKRNELVHYQHSELPVITTTQLWSHLEAILLLWIDPSVHTRRTMMAYLYDLYAILEDLQQWITEYEERPLMKDFRIRATTGVLFGCPFINVDEKQYPSMRAHLRELGEEPK